MIFWSIIPRVSSVSGTCKDRTSALSMTVPRSARSKPSSLALASVRYGSLTTTCIPKARQRCATSWPTRPAPTRPSVRPRSSAPLKRPRSHSPRRTEASAPGTPRTTESISASVSSAADTVLPAGALSTAMPRSVAASRSILSTPTPARPITFRLWASANMSESTFVALLTIKPSALVSALRKSVEDESLISTSSN